VVRLEEEIRRQEGYLSSPPEMGTMPLWEPPPLEAPEVGDYPLGEVRESWEEWRDEAQSPQGTGLEDEPRDLVINRQWRFSQIEADTQARIDWAHAEASQRLALLEERLYRERQVELNNAGLAPAAGSEMEPERIIPSNLPRHVAEAEAEQARRRIKSEIEQLLAEAEEQEAAHLAQVEQEAHAEAARRRAEVVAELQAEWESRRETELPSLLAPREEMEREGEEIIAQMPETLPARQLAGAELPEGASAAAAETRRKVLEALTAKQREQISRLRENQRSLLDAIHEDTVRAVARVAYDNNWRIHLLPGGEPQGADLTEQVRERLRESWSRYPGEGPEGR
jgi:hypothetical protein